MSLRKSVALMLLRYEQVMQNWSPEDKTLVLEASKAFEDDLYNLVTSQKETILDELLSEMPKMLVIIEAPEEYARQYALGRNGAISEVKAIIEKKRKEL